MDLMEGVVPGPCPATGYGGHMNGNTKIARLTPHHAMLWVAPDPDTGGVTVRVYGTLRKGRQTWQAHTLGSKDART